MSNLIASFVDQKDRTFNPGSREGTKFIFGEGFIDERKHKALLMLFMGERPNAVASKLEISIHTIRDWAYLDVRFKELFAQYCEEFADIFIKFLRQRAKEAEAELRKFLTLSIEECKQYERQPLFKGDDIREFRILNKTLRQFLRNRILNEMKDLTFATVCDLALCIFDLIENVPIRNAEIFKTQKLREKLGTNIVSEILQKTKLSDEDKKILIWVQLVHPVLNENELIN